MRAVQVVGVVLLLTGACTKPNPDYCDDSSTCTGGLVCNVAIHTCEVQMDASTSCSSNDQCIDPANPVCGEMQTCRACGLDDECTSGVCLADGRCEDAGSILYVSTSGISAGQCPADATCDLSYALTLVTDVRKTIRVAGGSYALAGAVLISPPMNELVLVGGRSAVFSRSSTGVSFDVRGGSKLTLRGVTITRGIECGTLSNLTVQRVAFTDAGTEVRPWIQTQQCGLVVDSSELVGSTSHGIDAPSSSVKITDTRITLSQGTGIRGPGSVELTKVEVTDNVGMGLDAVASGNAFIRGSRFSDNRQGGLSCAGTANYELVNNFIYHNGNPSDATFGGVLMLSTNQHRIEHNTIAYNERAYSTTAPVYAGGVYCVGSGSNANNLISYNFHGNTTEPGATTNGTCDFSTSIVSSTATEFNFVRPFALPFDFHLADAQSSAVNVGVSLPTPLSDDFDGDPRDDGQPDVGADEFRP